MRILTQHYGWINYISFEYYIDHDIEYVETIYKDREIPGVWPGVFNLLAYDHIDIVQGYDGTYYFTIIK